jgi:hypothetical protein
MRIEISLPFKIQSESNLREHWRVSHARHKKMRRTVTLAFYPYRNSFRLPCTVTITRIAPRELDFDNLISGCKYLRDYVADQIIPGLKMGQADHDPRITWVYMQEKGKPKEYGCKIVIEYAVANAPAPPTV